MDIIDAIEKRISCRAFEDKPVEQDKLDVIASEIAAINEESGLHFQLVGPREDGFVINLSTKMFASQPPCYIALVGTGSTLDKERVGYYGERVVLLAESLGLSTCWVAGTFDRSTARADMQPDEMLHDVIPLGYAPEKIPLKQRTIRSALRARSKKQADMYQGPVGFGQAPEWIRACIDAVWKAPTAINEQPVVFVQETLDTPVRATLPHVKSGMEYTDLGICKYHFQVVAEACGVKGTWEWGDGGAFTIA